MRNEIFADTFARRENIFTRIDARIKIAFIAASILTILSSKTPHAPFVAALLVITALSFLRVPFKILALRLAAPLGIALTLFLIKIFYCELNSGLLITAKTMGSTLLVLFLSMTTTLDRLLAACRWFRVPGLWIEICLIAYRYIFVLLEDAITVYDAQTLRLGYSSPIKAFRSIGCLAGAIIIRAYDQSIATYEAMMMRGYRG